MKMDDKQITLSNSAFQVMLKATQRFSDALLMQANGLARDRDSQRIEAQDVYEAARTLLGKIQKS